MIDKFICFKYCIKFPVILKLDQFSASVML